MPLHGKVKGFALWPQITLGQPALTDAQRKNVAETAADMFLAHFACSDSAGASS